MTLPGVRLFARRTFTTPKIRTFTTPKFGHFPPPKKKHLPGGQLPPPIFFLLFLAHFSWLFRLTAHGGHQGWEGGGAWWGGHGAHQVEGAWRGGHGAHQVGGCYHGGHRGRHGGGKVGWALCFCSWRLGSHISKYCVASSSYIQIPPSAGEHQELLLDVLARGQAARLLLSLQPADVEASQRWYCVCQLANWTKIHLFVFDDDLIIEAVFSWFWSDCFIRCRICKRLWEKGWLRSLRSDDLSFAICTSRAAGSGSSKNQW